MQPHRFDEDWTFTAAAAGEGRVSRRSSMSVAEACGLVRLIYTNACVARCWASFPVSGSNSWTCMAVDKTTAAPSIHSRTLVRYYH